ncbi:MAG: hypothetical protein ACLVCH_12320 [Roseburia inulinivorans]
MQNTSNIKIAVVSEDEGYTLSDGTTENMGNESCGGTEGEYQDRMGVP